MTCARDGAAACRRLFPDALWIDYTDPGYTLSIRVRKQLAAYREANGRQPAVVFLQSHGVFVAADTAGTVRDVHADVVGRLRQAYRAAGVPAEVESDPGPGGDAVARCEESIRAALGDDAAAVCYGGRFRAADGPVSPDHIVYEKPCPLAAEPSPEAAAAYRRRWGYAPRVILCGAGVFGVGPKRRDAELALELARDGALVLQLADAFGGIRYLSDRARDFIDHWEVEAYRRKLAEEA
jgi:rhamnose utilization protein RhaD (predicted bifunctional aldolase and dehydrogenase)